MGKHGNIENTTKKIIGEKAIHVFELIWGRTKSWIEPNMILEIVVNGVIQLLKQSIP